MSGWINSIDGGMDDGCLRHVRMMDERIGGEYIDDGWRDG